MSLRFALSHLKPFWHKTRLILRTYGCSSRGFHVALGALERPFVLQKKEITFVYLLPFPFFFSRVPQQLPSQGRETVQSQLFCLLSFRGQGVVGRDGARKEKVKKGE